MSNSPINTYGKYDALLFDALSPVAALELNTYITPTNPNNPANAVITIRWYDLERLSKYETL